MGRWPTLVDDNIYSRFNADKVDKPQHFYM